MQTLQKQLIALNRRANAASNAIKHIEKLAPKIAVKDAEIAALQASLTTCPEGQTKAGLTKRIETLKASAGKLVADLDTYKTGAAAILDLSRPYNPAPAATEDATTEAEPEQSAATGTEGGESPAE